MDTHTHKKKKKKKKIRLGYFPKDLNINPPHSNSMIGKSNRNSLLSSSSTLFRVPKN